MNLPETPCVYVVANDPKLRATLQNLLESVGLSTLMCTDMEALLAVYRPQHPGCLLLEITTVDDHALAHQYLRQQQIDTPVVVIAAHADVAMAVTALKQGALDFIEKPVNEQLLLDGVHHSLHLDAARRGAQRQRQDFLRRLATLTVREQDVLRWVTEGLSNREIAETLHLSHKTVEIHRAKVMQKMQANTLSQLIHIALALGVLKLYDAER